MKVTSFRVGFATNSSSSHSVVIWPGIRSLSDVAENYNPDHGSYEFGRGPEDYEDVHSLVNYAYLDTLHGSTVIKELLEKTSFTEVPNSWGGIRTRYDPDHYETVVEEAYGESHPELAAILKKIGPQFDGYIDHQSSGTAADEAPEEDAIAQFLWLCENLSGVTTDNDNH